ATDATVSNASQLPARGRPLLRSALRAERARRRERRGRRVLGDGGGVEHTWCNVVRRVGMKERRELLDVRATRPELELSAAVERDPVLLASRVEREEPLERAE